MRTKIIIEHDSVEALKSSELWRIVNELFLIDGPVSIDEVMKIDDQDD